jgi:hypothetical protein
VGIDFLWGGVDNFTIRVAKPAWHNLIAVCRAFDGRKFWRLPNLQFEPRLDGVSSMHQGKL